MDITLTDPTASDLAICACCNRPTRAAGGVVRRGSEPWIVYTLQWVPDMVPAHGASIRLSFAAWESVGERSERKEVCLDLLFSEDRKGLFVVDAWGDSLLAGEVRGMTRDEVAQGEFMDHVKHAMRLIWVADERFAEFRQLLPEPEVLTTGPSRSECSVSSAPGGSDPVSAAVEEAPDASANLARQNWPRFVTVFNAGEGETFQVKREFVEGAAREDLWILVTSVEGDMIRGRVGSEPSLISGVKQMDEVEFGTGEVIDWLVIDDGEYYAGGYSIPEESAETRAVRAMADKNNLPTLLLHRFLSGLDLSQVPIASDLASFEANAWKVLSENLDEAAEDFSEDEVRDAFHADFHRVVLWCRSVQVDLWHEGMQREPLTVEVQSDAAAGFSSGELLLKIHEAGLPFYSQVGTAYFAGLRFVYINEQGAPVYALLAHASRSGDLTK